MVPAIENTDGQIRISITTLSEVIAREVVQVPGVVDTFESILPAIKISENGQSFQMTDKVEIRHRSFEVNLMISLDPTCVFWKVASEVQKNVYAIIERQLGFSLQKVNVEVGKVEWSIT